MISRTIAIACALLAAGVDIGLWGCALVVVSAVAWNYASASDHSYAAAAVVRAINGRKP